MHSLLACNYCSLGITPENSVVEKAFLFYVGKVWLSGNNIALFGIVKFFNLEMQFFLKCKKVKLVSG